MQNCDGPITTDAVPSVENHNGPTDVDILKETPPVENRDAHITTDAVSSLENHDGPSDVDISKETPPAVDSSEPPVQNRDGPRSIDEPLVQDNGSESDVSSWDKKDSNDSNPDKDGSENQTDATQHEVIMEKTEAETERDNKLTTSNKIIIDPAVERDLGRCEAIVTLSSTKKTHSTRTIPP